MSIQNVAEMLLTIQLNLEQFWRALTWWIKYWNNAGDK